MTSPLTPGSQETAIPGPRNGLAGVFDSEQPIGEGPSLSPWPGVVAARRTAIGPERTFDYYQCTRRLCRRWFPDERYVVEPADVWCQWCSGKARRALRKWAERKPSEVFAKWEPRIRPHIGKPVRRSPPATLAERRPA